MPIITAERIRLNKDVQRKKYWKRWGPHLAERQCATLGEDDSPDGSCREHFFQGIHRF